MKLPPGTHRYRPLFCATCAAGPFLLLLCATKAPSPGTIRSQAPQPLLSPATTGTITGIAGLPPATLAMALRHQLTAVPQLLPAGTGQFTLDDLAAQIPRTTDGFFLIPLPLLAFSASDAAARRTMHGLSIETTALVDHVDPANQSLQLSRLLTRCCADDAVRHSISASLSIPTGNLTTGTWITARGRIAYQHTPLGSQASILIDSFTPVATPANPILR
jgi:hypothetical protein